MPDLESLFAWIIPMLQQGQQVPSLGQIGNQTPITPPFVGTFPTVGGNAGGQIPGLPQQQNPYAMLETILNNLSNQPLAQAPQPGKVQSILDALQGGIAVALSKDPSSVLTQQLQGRQQQRALREQQLQQRQNMIDSARLQIGVQQATDIAKEQADIRRAQREELREEKIFQRNREAALVDLKKTGIVNQELADMEAKRALDFYRNNKFELLSQAEDKAYINSLPEKDQAALILATRWKTLDPATDSVLLNELARKVVRGRAQLGILEKQLYNRLEGLVADEASAEKEELKKRKVSEREQIEAVTEATKTGQRYAGQQDRFANAFAQQQGAQASRVTSSNFYKNKNDPTIVIDEDQFAKLKGTVQVFDYLPMSEEENVQERNRRFIENAERNKRAVERQKTQPTATNVTGGETIDLANDAAGSRIAELFAKQGLEATRKVILESNAPQQEKLRLMQLLERLSGKKIGVTGTVGAPTSVPSTADERLKKAQEAGKKFQNFKN